MQKAPSTPIAAGNSSNSIPQDDKGLTEIYILSGLVILIAVVVAGLWHFSQPTEGITTTAEAPYLTGTQVSDVSKESGRPLSAFAAVPADPGIPTPTAVVEPVSVRHEDLFFDLGRKGLTDEAKAALAKQAEFLKSNPDWGVLVQGHTDQQGSSSYNQVLGLKRAEAVKQELIAFGVGEQAIKAVSLGEQGVICIDKSDYCRRLNRRVHLELRQIGADHMTIPQPVIVPSTQEVSQVTDTEPLPNESTSIESTEDSATISISPDTESSLTPTDSAITE